MFTSRVMTKHCLYIITCCLFDLQVLGGPQNYSAMSVFHFSK